MKMFVIDSSNSVQLCRSKQAACRDGTCFANEKEFAACVSTWPLARLAAVWNRLPGVAPVRKFTDRRTALQRIWGALQALEPERHTKSNLIVELLQRPSGATIAELMEVTRWQAHSIRAFLSAQLPKKLGHHAKSFEREGLRAYRITRRKS